MFAAYRGEFKAFEAGAQSRPPPAKKTSYNRSMLLAIFAIRLATVLFFLGLAGSAVVVLISFVEDAKELFGDD
jgi:hypothetical protein